MQDADYFTGSTPVFPASEASREAILREIRHVGGTPVLTFLTSIEAKGIKVQARKYNISVEQYKAMLTAQDSKCKICQKPEIPLKRLAVDHDHSNGMIRGLLCNDCNNGLGNFRDNTTILASAIQYLTNQPAV